MCGLFFSEVLPARSARCVILCNYNMLLQASLRFIIESEAFVQKLLVMAVTFTGENP